MGVVCTVRIPHPLAKVQEVEATITDEMAQIMAAAQKYMTGHRRVTDGAEVLDIDTYASREDYDAFLGEAGAAVKKYGELLGARDTLYEDIPGGD